MSTPTLTRRSLGVLLGTGIVVSACSTSESSSVAGGAKSTPALAGSLRDAPGTVSAFPPPGSQTASPATSISFRGLTASKAAAIAVTGSVSGSHAGALTSHSDGLGVSFVPDRNFTAGETVTVSTGLDVRGSHRGVMRFRVATPVTTTTSPVASTGTTTRTTTPVTAFVSAPAVQAPILAVAVNSTAAAPGLLTLAPKGGGLPGQLLLARSDGSVLWCREAPIGLTANNLSVQRWKNQPVLTWWQGTQSAQGYGSGEFVLLDSSYRQITTVTAGNGFSGDLHDFQLTDGGTALMTIYAPVRWNLKPYGGAANGTALDSIVQEIDVATGLVIFEWHALDHIDPAASYFDAPTSATTAWDFFHVNSIDVGAGGDLLISARHTSTLTNLDRSTGDVLWTLGGKKSDFTAQGTVAWFCQHDARWQSDGTITLFDDGGGPPRKSAAARGLRLNVDTTRRTVSIVAVYSHPSAIVSNSQGNAQQLDNGNVLVGWGDQPQVTEFDSTQAVVWDAKLPTGVTSYRAYRSAWVGSPKTPPASRLVSQGARRTVYVSWNGDTRTVTWRLLGVTSGANAPSVLATADGGVFEATLVAPSGAARLRVQAVDAAGEVLATVTPTM